MKRQYHLVTTLITYLVVCQQLHGEAKPPVVKSDKDPAVLGLASEKPTWSVGLQAGSLANTGITAQKSGVLGGAVNATLGLGYWSPVVIIDYLRFFNDAFQPYAISDEESVAASRGLLLPYLSGGLQVGQGFGIRGSVGAQYTMLEDPVNFFGGATLLIGPCKCEPYLFSAGRVFLGINIGVRLML